LQHVTPNTINAELNLFGLLIAS